MAKRDEAGEVAIEGWAAIARMFGVSLRKAKGWRQELHNGGFIFYVWRGKPPRKRVCAFPSRLVAWSAMKSAKYFETL